MKSREGKFPAPVELATLIRHWKTVWPSATISSERMKQLYPYILQKWREGWTLAQIAQTACSCNDGQNIAPSPAALKVVPKRHFSLPPTGAVPGQTFGADEIRDVGSVTRLKTQRHIATLKQKAIGAELEIVFERMRVAPESARARLEAQREKLVGQLAQLQQAANDATARLAELESTGRLPVGDRKPRVKKEPKPAPAPAKAARAKRPAKAVTPAAPPAPAPAPAPAPSPPSTDDVEDAIAKLYEDD
jgi:hypothetical protein